MEAATISKGGEDSVFMDTDQRGVRTGVGAALSRGGSERYRALPLCTPPFHTRI